MGRTLLNQFFKVCDLMDAFKDRLRQEREFLGWSQTELAYKLGLTPSTINKYESGTRFPDIETLVKIADLFITSTDYLLGRDNSSPKKLSITFADGRTVDIENLPPEEKRLLEEIFKFVWNRLKKP